MFFRGLLQSMLRRYTNSPWIAILGSSAAFGLIHSQNPHTVPALVVLGIILGYHYERTDRLLAPILIHSIFNILNIAIFMGSGG